MTPNGMVREFMVKFERPVDVEFNLEDIELCANLINEETNEVLDEIWTGDVLKFEVAPNKEKVTKELCDLIYVCYYTANKFGLPIEEAFKRVHESNLSKLDNDGKPILREDGKILKSENYKPAQLGDLFDR